MKISHKTVVTLCYELFVQEGRDWKLMDQRDRQNPIEILFGQGLLLPEVEKVLLDKKKGFQVRIELPAHLAFGERREELAVWVPRHQLPSNPPLQVGMKFQTQGPDRSVMSVVLQRIEDDRVLLDGNHPLAGSVICFELEVLHVRGATDEEIATGEVQKRFH